MTKAKQTKSPSQLSKPGKKAGVELTEGQLGQAAGGAAVALKWNLKI